MSTPVTEPQAARLAILEVLLQAARANDIEAYAAGYVELIEFEREQGLVDSDQPVCVICGCTDDDGCPGGCHWVLDNLCSRCLATLAATHLGMILPAAAPGAPSPAARAGLDASRLPTSPPKEVGQP